ncbi:hypothetical protein BGX28_007312 [Mortierella sp. GBA30]|nr:hypothetical protein BGX28_007312 [Mortierella sp. GBA30]
MSGHLLSVPPSEILVTADKPGAPVTDTPTTSVNPVNQDDHRDTFFKRGPVSPENWACWSSRIILWWMGSLFRIGYRRRLEEDDIYEMLDRNKVAPLHQAMSENWEREQQRAKLKSERPSLIRTTAWTFWRRHYFAVISMELRGTQSYKVIFKTKQVIKFVNASRSESPPPVWHGYGLALAMAAISLAQNTLYQQMNVSCLVLGILIRGSLIDMIFRKATTLSARLRLVYQDGAIVNLMSTDASRIDTSMFQLLQLVSIPIYMFVVLSLLVHLMGPSALLGAAILVLVNPLQAWIMSKLARIRKRASEFTDNRIRLTSEILQGIKIIKFFAWETRFLQKLSEIRKQELRDVGRLLLIRSVVAAASVSLPVFASALSFIIYVAIGNKLRADIIFPAMAYFTLLRAPLMVLPSSYTTVADAYVAMKRIEKFLLSEDASPIPPPDLDHRYALTIKNASFLWEELPPTGSNEHLDGAEKKSPSSGQSQLTSKQDPTTGDESMITSTSASETISGSSYLSNLNLQIPRGSLVAVVGPVGSGKSSLLQAVVGNMTQSSGEIIRGTNISYASQTAWIQNATIRDNILLDTPFDERRYWRVVKACCLEQDLALFHDGDLTEIGERGVNLSGGQKARVSLARSVYFNAGMVIMDDPLSAVDAHVGKRLWQDCVLNELKGRTRIIATHQLHILRDADYIICMKDGTIVEEGSFSNLMTKNGDFCALMAQYGGLQKKQEGSYQDVPDEDVKSKMANITLSATLAETTTILDAEKYAEQKEYKKKQEIDRGSFDEPVFDEDTKGRKTQKLMSEEERETGAVKGNVYGGYIRASGTFLWVSVFGFFALQQFANVMSNQWITWWSADELKLDQNAYIGIYVGWALAQLVLVFIAAILLSYAVVKTANNMHDAAFKRVLYSPLAFFDTTPMGRILNRFSRDVDILDNVLWNTLYEFTITAVTLMGTIVLVIFVFPWLMLAVVPLMGLYYALSVYYRSTSREIKRLDSNMRSHLYAYFAECLTGLGTMKAFNVVHKAILKNERRIDLNNRSYYLFQLGTRWLSIRVNVLGVALTFSTVILIVATRNTINPASAGLVLTYLARISGDLNWGVHRFTTLENDMNSAERLVHYVQNLVQERPAEKPQTKPDPTWPAHGQISFQNVSMRYRQESPRVLMDISFDIQAGHKVGVVGRTGAGKSSLIHALFLLSELENGQILLDGINTQDIGTAELRSHIAIIPQDPVLFQGTFRYNLDPLDRHTEQELWGVLETSDLKAYVQTQGGLDAMISAYGENLSVGQRQLVCLSRALLADSKVVVLDEATASVDMATDALIQKAIRVDFASSTVVTVAHRINTIIDYDRILVMNKGQLAEYDTAYNLLSNPSSIFSSMVAETGAQNSALLHSLVGLEQVS